MSGTTIKSQVENFLPLLSTKQQSFVLEMIKSLLNIDSDKQRVSKKQYNKELKAAVARIESGKGLTEQEVENELSKW